MALWNNRNFVRLLYIEITLFLLRNENFTVYCYIAE